MGEVLDFSFHKQMLVEEHVLVSYIIWGHQVFCVMIVLCLLLACCKAIKTVSFQKKKKEMCELVDAC